MQPVTGPFFSVTGDEASGNGLCISDVIGGIGGVSAWKSEVYREAGQGCLLTQDNVRCGTLLIEGC